MYWIFVCSDCLLCWVPDSVCICPLQYVLPSAVEAELSSQITSPTSMLSEEDRSFCELFSLPLTECPLSGNVRTRSIHRSPARPACCLRRTVHSASSFPCPSQSAPYQVMPELDLSPHKVPPYQVMSELDLSPSQSVPYHVMSELDPSP